MKNCELKQICMVYWDLKKAEEYWTGILGIEPEYYYTPLWNVVPSFTDGKADTFQKMELLIYHLDNDIILEMTGPGEDNGNPWRRHLEKYGEGIMNFAFFVNDRPAIYKQIGEFCKEGNPYHEGFYPNATYSFVDTMKEVGAELNIKKLEDNVELIDRLNHDPNSYFQGKKTSYWESVK